MDFDGDGDVNLVGSLDDALHTIFVSIATTASSKRSPDRIAYPRSASETSERQRVADLRGECQELDGATIDIKALKGERGSVSARAGHLLRQRW